MDLVSFRDFLEVFTCLLKEPACRMECFGGDGYTRSWHGMGVGAWAAAAAFPFLLCPLAVFIFCRTT